MRRVQLASLLVPVVLAIASGPLPGAAATAGAGNGLRTQTDWAYAGSFAKNGVTNVFATTQQTSCYRPEVPFFTVGEARGYTGMTACPGATTTEDIGTTAYPNQAGSVAGYPALGPMLVNDHSESDLRVDPKNPSHIIASSKWFASAEGYNHVLGFYESWDGGTSWPVQGHIPGYEGFTDNTDPVGAFDGYGNYYSLNLPYQFYYDPSGGHNFQINRNKEPNPSVAPEVISVSVRPHGSTTAAQWITTHNGAPDYVAPDPMKGHEPDKQWLTIDTNPSSPHYNTIYAMWAIFDGINSKPLVSTAHANADGSHTDWTDPQLL